MIKVYFEQNLTAEIVAKFRDDSMYMACLPALEKIAKKEGKIITESNEELEEV